MARGVDLRGRGSARLGQRDINSLLEFLRKIYEVRGLGSFRRHVVSGLQNLVPSEIIAYNEVNLRTQHNEVVYDRPEAMNLPDADRIFDRYIPEHPLISYRKSTLGHNAVKISDLVSAAHFHQLGLYYEFFRRIGIEDQMALTLPSPRPVVVGIALNRSRPNFSERDRLLLNLAYPHLLQAYRNTEAWTRLTEETGLIRDTLEESQVAVVVLTRANRVQTITSQARLLLAKYLPGQLSLGEALPELLMRWVKWQCARLASSTDAPPRREPLVLGHDGKHLIVRLFSSQSQTVLLLDEPTATTEDMDSLGLTRREEEVLAWVAPREDEQRYCENPGYESAHRAETFGAHLSEARRRNPDCRRSEVSFQECVFFELVPIRFRQRIVAGILRTSFEKKCPGC